MKAFTSTVRLLSTVAVAAAMLGVAATQADAAAPAAPDASAVVITTTSTTVAAPATAAAEKCWYNHSAQSAKIAGTVLWTMEQIVNWCGKSGKVTRITSNRNYFSHVNGSVSFKDGDPHVTVSKPSSKEWIDRTSATMHWCVLKVGCIATYHPWIETAIYGNGTRSSGGGF
jgi:hypothetical protein